MINYKEENPLPGHAFIKQKLVSSGNPLQSSPPCAGGGLSHVLVRVLVPLPHVTEHVVHVPQIDQPPSTNNMYSIDKAFASSV